MQAHLRAGHCTDRSPSHRENEDCFALGVWRHGFAVIVADGMGGRSRGATAARIAIDELCGTLERSPDTAPPDLLRLGLEAAHVGIQRIGADPSGRRLGAACAAALIQGGRFWVANTGDVRVYRVPAGGGIVRLSLDHTLLQQRVDRGEIDWSSSHGHPDARVLSGFLGQRGALRFSIDDDAVPLKVGDRIVVCSDGVGSAVRDTEIGRVASSLDPVDAAVQLVALARAKGSRDDVTAVVVELLSSSEGAFLEPLALVESLEPEPSALEASTLFTLPKGPAPTRLIGLVAALVLVVVVAFGAILWGISGDHVPDRPAGPLQSAQAGEPQPVSAIAPDAAAPAADAAPAEAPPATVTEALTRKGRDRDAMMMVLQGRHRRELLAQGPPPQLASDASLPEPLPDILDRELSVAERATLLRKHLEALVLASDAAGLRRLDAEITFRARRGDVAQVLLQLIDTNPEPIVQRWALEQLGN
jgi:protein phosphatase